MLLRLYTLTHHFKSFWHLGTGLSARAPECQNIKNGGLDQYDAEPFKQQQFWTAGIEGVKVGLYTGQVTGWVTCDVSSGTSNW